MISASRYGFWSTAALLTLGACGNDAGLPPGVAGSSAGGAGSSATAGAAGSSSGASAGGAGGTTSAVGGAGAGGAGGNGGAAGGGSGGAAGGNSSGAAGAGASGGGSGGTSGGGAGMGGSGGSGGVGSSADGWVEIFNGQDLTGWVPLIHKSTYKENIYDTFRADPTNQVLRVTYEDYPQGNFDGRCGLLYYDKYLKDFRVRLTYRFLEPQAKNPTAWGKNNTGLMLFGIDPATVKGDPEFPPAIEIQLIGTPSTGGKNNANLCQPGGMWVSKLFGQTNGSGNGCKDSKSGTALPAAEWVTIEAEVHPAGETKIYQHPNLTDPVLVISGPMYNGQPVLGGYIAVQSESQPIEFKDIRLKELP